MIEFIENNLYDVIAWAAAFILSGSATALFVNLKSMFKSTKTDLIQQFTELANSVKTDAELKEVRDQYLTLGKNIQILNKDIVSVMKSLTDAEILASDRVKCQSITKLTEDISELTKIVNELAAQNDSLKDYLRLAVVKIKEVLNEQNKKAEDEISNS